MLACLLTAAFSLAGALVFTLGELRGVPPWQSSLADQQLFLFVWVALVAWALLFGALLRGGIGASWNRSLFSAALCHAPLLLGLVLVLRVYGDGPTREFYVSSRYGQQLFQTLAKDFVVGAPLVAQSLLFLTHRFRSLTARVPLLLILLVASALRFTHLGWGLPGLLHPDEHRYMGPAIIMAARGDLHPYYFENPSLLIYATLGVFKALTPQSIAFHSMNEFFNLGIQDPRGDFLQTVAVRGLSALAGVLTVLSAYLAGKDLFGRRAGLAGAALLAVSFLHVRNSQYSTNDVLATLFLSLSFLYATRIYSRGTASDYYLAALFGGLGTSTKYNAGVFFIAIVVAHLASAHGTPWRRHSLGFHLRLVAAAGVALAAFVAGTPYALLDYRSFRTDFLNQLSYGSQPWTGQDPEPAVQMFGEALLQGFGLLPLALAIAGVGWASAKDRFRLAILLSIPCLYTAFMSRQELFFARFAIPTLPFLAILAGYGVERMVRWIRWERWRPAALVLLVLGAVAQPLSLAVKHDILIGRTDTRHMAAAWVDAHVPRGSSIAIESFAQLDPKFGWKGFEGRDARTFWPGDAGVVAEWASGRNDFVLVSSFGYGPAQQKGDSPSMLRPPYDELEKRGKLVALFGAGWENAELPYALDDMYTPFWRLDERERPGPTVRIYQLGGQ